MPARSGRGRSPTSGTAHEEVFLGLSAALLLRQPNGAGRHLGHDADGTGQRFVVEGGEPGWSPFGDEIVYDCGGPDHPIICAVHPDGSDPVRSFEDAGFPVVQP